MIHFLGKNSPFSRDVLSIFFWSPEVVGLGAILPNGKLAGFGNSLLPEYQQFLAFFWGDLNWFDCVFKMRSKVKTIQPPQPSSHKSPIRLRKSDRLDLDYLEKQFCVDRRLTKKVDHKITLKWGQWSMHKGWHHLQMFFSRFQWPFFFCVGLLPFFHTSMTDEDFKTLFILDLGENDDPIWLCTISQMGVFNPNPFF